MPGFGWVFLILAALVAIAACLVILARSALRSARRSGLALAQLRMNSPKLDAPVAHATAVLPDGPRNARKAKLAVSDARAQRRSQRFVRTLKRWEALGLVHIDRRHRA
ncbi:hypothetical protein SAMN02910418_01458 [Bowdeniella nasicola]|uniref:Uncharacterized protein n=1 Tax=Bowdeniella nasicola TaxID=208480 RepID=A0A1H4AP12_9ACTO|nr:hypothetical protein SAMN02910418_01458 [Bowdeniella nasicola]